MVTIFAAIRKTTDSGTEWVDVDSSSFDLERCRGKIRKDDNYIPHWAKDNPVIRISEFELKECFVVEKFSDKTKIGG